MPLTNEDHTRIAEARRRAKAVPWSDDMAGLMDDEDYYACPEDYFEYLWLKNDQETPDPDEHCYEYEAVEEGVGLHAESILESAWENAEPPDDDNFKPPWTPEDVARLQTLLDDWLGNLKTEAKWYISGRYVNLTEVRKAWCESVRKEQNEDAT